MRADITVLIGSVGKDNHDSGVQVRRRRPDGVWDVGPLLPLENPTFFARSARPGLVYASQSGTTRLAELFIDGLQVSLVDSVQIGAVNPAHLAVHPSGGFLMAACFTAGRLVSVTLREDGGFDAVSEPIAVPSPTNPQPRTAQDGNEPHQIVFSPSGRHLLVPDRGADAVHVFVCSPSADLTLQNTVRVRPASGPRHLVFNPLTGRDCYGVGEFDSSIVHYSWSEAEGELRPLSTHSVLPADFFGDSAAAAICMSIDGRWLVATNRGHDSVAWLRVGADGRPLPNTLRWTASGTHPRFASFINGGSTLAVAARDSNTVTLFDLDPADGALIPAAAIEIAGPMCVLDV